MRINLDQLSLMITGKTITQRHKVTKYLHRMEIQMYSSRMIRANILKEIKSW